MKRPRSARPAASVLLLAAGALTLLLAVVDPALSAFLPGCPIRALTGLLCAGCGSTRALQALARGDPGAAFLLNPLLVVSLPVLAALLARWFAAGFAPRPLPRWLPWLAVAAVALFTVARNLPFETFRTFSGR